MNNSHQDLKTVNDELLMDDDNFISCVKCPLYLKSVKDWMKHLVELHPTPQMWMSDKDIDKKCLTPYTIVTESRKKRKKNTTPRPLNSFMIFSSHLRRVILLFFTSASNSEISKLLGKFWTTMPLDIKTKYDLEAKRLATLHSKEFPDYKYQPQKKNRLLKRKLDGSMYNHSDVSKCDNNEKVTNTIFEKSKTTNEQFVKVFHNSSSSPSHSIHKINDSIYRTTKYKNITISTLMADDMIDTESSVSSYKLPTKRDICQSISPVSNLSFGKLSERNFSSPISNVADNELESLSNICTRKKIISVLDCQRISSNEINNKNKFILQEVHLPFTQPLTVLTDKIDARESYPFWNFNSNISNIQPIESINKNTGQPKIIQSFNNKSNFKQSHKTESVIKCNHVKIKDERTTIRKSEYESNCHDFFTDIPMHNSDPLITEDVCDNNNFIGDYLEVDNEYNYNCPQWSLPSPKFKWLTVSPNSSDNVRENYSSPSPFLLSETRQNFIPAQKLPAISSWLRSNNSEYTI